MYGTCTYQRLFSETVGLSSKTFSIQQESTLPPNYYWVGGSGSWSEYAHHWATSSGGANFHSAPPTFLNNVVFDANSFSAAGQPVTVDTTASCNNMTWITVTDKTSVHRSNGEFINSAWFNKDGITRCRKLYFGGTKQLTFVPPFVLCRPL